MRTILFLTAAIACEVAWAIGLKFIKGWESVGAIALTVTTYLAAVVFLTLATRKMEIGIAYAIWAGSGVALIALVGILALKESVTPLKLASLALVILGVVGLSLSGTHGK